MKILLANKYKSHLCLCFLTGIVLFLAGQLQARNQINLVTLEGITQEWKGGAHYTKLPNVQVVVTRSGRLVDSTISDISGDYKIAMRQGEPIHVVYHLSKQYLPEMQSLSGATSIRHQVSPSLMTIAQYRKMQRLSAGKLPPIYERLKCVSRYVPRESKAFKDINAMIKEYEPKL